MRGMCGLQADDKLTWKCMGLIWLLNVADPSHSAPDSTLVSSMACERVSMSQSQTPMCTNSGEDACLRDLCKSVTSAQLLKSKGP